MIKILFLAMIIYKLFFIFADKKKLRNGKLY